MRPIGEIRSASVEVLFAELTDFIVKRFEEKTGSEEAGLILRQNIKLTFPEALEQSEQLRLFMPTQFLCSLIKGVFSVADPLKSHLAQNFPKYDFEVESLYTWYLIKKNLLQKYYPLECPYWELFDEGKFKEAQALLPGLKKYRKKFEDCFYLEVFYWGMNNAALLYDEDSFFRTYDEARIERPEDGILANPERFMNSLGYLLQERFKERLHIGLTAKGISMAELHSDFKNSQQWLLTKFLLNRIAYETCVARSIRSGEGFRFFIEDGWDQLQSDYSKTNEYVAFVEYEK